MGDLPRWKEYEKRSCCDGWSTQMEDGKNMKCGLIVMGDLPKEGGKSGLIVMGDLPKEGGKSGLIVMGDLPKWKNDLIVMGDLPK